jgi:hypothetical protein
MRIATRRRVKKRRKGRIMTSVAMMTRIQSCCLDTMDIEFNRMAAEDLGTVWATTQRSLGTSVGERSLAPSFQQLANENQDQTLT